jgi:hypothetical protein
MGLREAVARSTLADANETRDWRIWADIAAVLIRRARKLYVSDDNGSASRSPSPLASLAWLPLGAIDWSHFEIPVRDNPVASPAILHGFAPVRAARDDHAKLARFS